MTITPEKLRAEAENASPLSAREALRCAADYIEHCHVSHDANVEEIARLEAALADAAAGIVARADRRLGQVTTKPNDDCECVVCETLRNPPPPTEYAVQLMRSYRKSQGDNP